MIDEWEDEEKGDSPGYVECEEPTMEELETKGVPEEEWPYYLGYMKRMLAFYRQYTGATLQLEKTSLIEEYVLRGKNRDVLEQVQDVTEECAGIAPPPPPPTCPCDRTDGFETGAKDVMWTVIGADPYEIVNTPAYVYQGIHGAKSKSDTGVWFHALTGTNTTKWFKWHYKIVPNPDSPPAGFSGDRLLIVKITGGVWEQWVELNLLTGRPVSPCFQLMILGNEDKGTHVLAGNTWYCLKLKITADGTNIVATLYIDDEVDCTLTFPYAGADTFSEVVLEAVQWTFGRDCRTALDCWCEVDSDTEPLCLLPDVCWEV